MCVFLSTWCTSTADGFYLDKQTSTDEEGRVVLTSPSTEHLNGGGDIALNDTDIPVSMRRPKKKSGCCVCCGIE